MNHVHSLKTKSGAYNKIHLKRQAKYARDLEFAVSIPPFDNSAMIVAYAERWLRHGFVHESLEDAAEQCAGDLKDPKARLKFKQEVKRRKDHFHLDDE